MNFELIHSNLNTHPLTSPASPSLLWLSMLLWNLCLVPLPGVAATNCGSQGDIPAIECNALLDLYNSTNGSSWTDSPGNGWNQNDNPCGWTGVVCGSGKVTQLLRNSQNLSGTLPASLNNLILLSILDLGNNRLTGNVPPLPSSLSTLNLSGNAFSGYLPSFAGLTGLNAPNLNLDYNLFQGPYSGEAALVSSKQPNWQNTQTVPPTGLTATALSSSQIQVNWTPIPYTADGGYYQVKYSTTPGGPYTLAASTTPDKNASSYVVTGLTPNTTYYFVVETFTPAHFPQQNNLTSAPTPETSVTTPSCAALSVTNTADSGPGSLREAIAQVCAGGTITINASPIELTSGELMINKDLTIITAGNTNQTIQRNPASPTFRIFNIDNATVTLNNLTLFNGSAYEGGGIYVNSDVVLNLNWSKLSNNTASMYGGGIYSIGQVTVSNSTFSNNTVPNGGGGGAIFNANSLTIHDSTFSANSATSSGGAIFSNNGNLNIVSSTFENNSASHYGGAIRNDASLTVINSTFSGNSAYGGGGINNYGGTLTVNNSTFSGNSANLMGGAGLYNNSIATLNLTNTLIANSTGGGDCANLGTLATNTQNLIEDGSCSPALSGDPLLGTLQNYGTTSTFALLAGSPAIDAGDNASCHSSDQGGIGRPIDGNCDGLDRCDIGAYEYQISCPTSSPVAPPTGTLPTETPPPTVPVISCQVRTTVTRTEDDYNSGSLRNAIAQTCSNGLIDFADMVIDPIYLSRPLVISQNLTISGGSSRHVTISGDSNQDGSGEVQVFEISSGNVTFNNLIITHGKTTSGGGAGIHVNPEATLTLNNCQLRNNQTRATYSTDNGGGLLNEGTSFVNNSTFYKNHAWDGGGIYNTGTLTLINSTIAEGYAEHEGGGIYNANSLGINNSTLAWNKAIGGNGGGIYNFAGLGLTNTLVARSYQGGDCYNSDTAMITADSNLIEDGSCGQLMSDPLLGEPVILDETTPTFTLLAGSPAIDAGDNATCATNDQLSKSRPYDGDYDGLARCDVGAYEYGDACLHTVLVTTTTDHEPGSLREAISKVCHSGTLRLMVGGTFSLTSELVIDKNVTIDGTERTFSITDFPILTQGHRLDVIGEEITLGTVDTSGIGGTTAGSVRVTALTGNLTMKNIQASSDTFSNNAEAGGEVELTATLGSIQLGDIATYSRSEQAHANVAGNVTITAGNGITVGAINASAFDSQGEVGAGGIIRLGTSQGDLMIHGYLHTGTTTQNGLAKAGDIELFAPAGKIMVDSYLLGGLEANINITAGQTFQAKGEIPEMIGNTIYTGGSITIRHGGQGLLPFTVGSDSENGTTYGITSLSTTVPPGQYFDSYILAPIQILTGNQPVVPQYASNPPPGSTLDFGESPIATPVTVLINLIQKGSVGVLLTSPQITGATAEVFSVLTTFPVTLMPEADAQSILIQCLPTSAEEHTATLQWTTNDPLHPTATYELICNGVEVMGPAYHSQPAPGEVIHTFPASLTDAEPIDSALILELLMMETGMEDLTVHLVGITGPQASEFAILQPAFPVIIPDQGEPVWVKILCNPSVSGPRLANLELSTNDPLHPLVTYPLHCVGEEMGPIYYSQPAPDNILTMTQDELGSPTTTAEVAIWNIGNQPLDLLTSYISGDQAKAFHLIQGAAPVSLPANSEKHTLLIQCDPVSAAFPNPVGEESVNTAMATLTVTTNDPVQPILNYGLTCTRLVATVQPSVPPVSNLGSAPADILLSNATIPEHSPAGTLIGRLTTVDPDPTDSHFYTLTIDSGQFIIVGNELRLADGVSLDFETLPDYFIAVRSTDQTGLFVEKSFAIQVTDIDELSKLPLQLATGQFSGEIRADSGQVGDQVSIANPEHFILTGKIQPLPEHLKQLANVMLIYQWQPEAGGNPLSGTVTIAKRVSLKEMKMTLFQGNLAGLAGIFNISLGYQLVTPDSPLVYAPIATLTVQANQPPTSITLSATTVAENSPPGTVIGHFTTTDTDYQEWFTYSLIDDLGYRLQIVGNELRTGGFPLDFENISHPQVTVRSFDTAGDFIEQTFTLTVTDVEPKPEAIRLTRQTVFENSPTGTVVGRLVTTSREGGTFHYELLDDAGGRFALQDDLLVVADGEQLVFEQQARHTIMVQVQEVDTSATLENTLTIEVLKRE